MMIDFKEYVPISKTKIKDCVLLEIQDGTHDLENYLFSHIDELNEDCKACYLALKDRDKRKIHVLNNRSLKIGLIVLREKLGQKYDFIEGKQLAKRKLDPNSSQWSSARILCGLEQRVKDTRYHVQIAREVLKRWNYGERETIFREKDDTILAQLEFVFNDKPLEIKSAEDVPIGVIFDLIDLDDAIKKFPTIYHHESNRTTELEKVEWQFDKGEPITSTDHRIVMAMKLWAWKNQKRVRFTSKAVKCVAKSFPDFWSMMHIVDRIGYHE